MNLVCVFLCALLSACAAPVVSADGSYAEDRARIEDLAARYMFALDFRDADAYAATFTEDGILDWGAGTEQGREAIRAVINGMRERAEQAAATDESGLRPAAGRHNISNIVIKVDGDRARMVAYWFHHGNDNPDRSSSVTSYGHYEDELVKVNGEWLFSKRRIYNEQVADWAAKGSNPSW